MKKILYLALLMLILNACGPTNYTEVRQMGYSYTALAEPEDKIGQNVGAYGASMKSQREATNNAMSYCRTAYTNCVLTYEGSRYVYVSQQEKNKIALEKSLATAVQRSKKECVDLGFSVGTQDYADCNLKLSSLYKEEALEKQKIMLAEQQAEMAKRQAEAARRQAEAVEKQARAAKWRQSQDLIKKGQKMMTGQCTLGINC